MRTWRCAVIATVLLAVPAAARAAEIPQSGTLDLAAGADVRIGGLGESSFTGFSVARAGDVNGDGLADVLVSAPQADAPGRTGAGAVFVLFGRRDKAPIDLANLGGAGFRVDGAAPGDEAGLAVAPAGDQNGDGLADFVVGAPAIGSGRPGAAYVVYGKRDTAAIDLASPGAGAYRIAGAQPDDNTGFAVGSVGDLNGDGRSELLVGAPRYDVNASDRVDAGAVFVVYGGGAPAAVDLAALGSGGYRIDGEGHGFAGWSVAGSADMNGDGHPEVVLGAPFTDAPGAPGAGSAYVVWGRTDTAGVDLAALGAGGFRMNGGLGRGPAAGAEGASAQDQGTSADVGADTLGEAAGAAVAALGDVNGDGVPDVAVGAQLADRGSRLNAGSVYVVHGKASSDPVDLASVGTDPTGGFRVDGAAPRDLTGTGVSEAGDVNGDGRGDLLVSAPLAAPLSRDQSGATYVLYGQAAEKSVDLAAIGDAGFRIAGPGSGDTTSRHAAGVGDFNGDGAPDLLLGGPLARPKPACSPDTSPQPCPTDASEADRGPRAGAAFLVFSPKPVPPPPPDPGQVEEVQIDKCVATSNVEVIVDDSGSMETTDPGLLRRQALELLLSKPRNQGDVLGALEFGDFADQLFPPEPIDPRQTPALFARLRELLMADNGGTDYNAAFTAAGGENPAAGARIFLTDGGHNVGAYTGGHAGGPPTYVIGLDIGRRGPDAERLARIAKDTGGEYFPNVGPRRLQPVLGRIDSRLNCDIGIENFPDTLLNDTDTQTSNTPLDGGTHSTDVSVTWDDPADQLAVDHINYYRRGNRKPLALFRRGNRKPTATITASMIRHVLRTGRPGGHGALRVSGKAGSTFVTLRVTGLGPGRLQVVVGAKKVKGTSHVVTQVSQSRRRR
jgi:hypothetical protein